MNGKLDSHLNNPLETYHSENLNGNNGQDYSDEFKHPLKMILNVKDQHDQEVKNHQLIHQIGLLEEKIRNLETERSEEASLLKSENSKLHEEIAILRQIVDQVEPLKSAYTLNQQEIYQLKNDLVIQESAYRTLQNKHRQLMAQTSGVKVYNPSNRSIPTDKEQEQELGLQEQLDQMSTKYQKQEKILKNLRQECELLKVKYVNITAEKEALIQQVQEAAQQNGRPFQPLDVSSIQPEEENQESNPNLSSQVGEACQKSISQFIEAAKQEIAFINDETGPLEPNAEHLSDDTASTVTVGDNASDPIQEETLVSLDIARSSEPQDEFDEQKTVIQVRPKIIPQDPPTQAQDETFTDESLKFLCERQEQELSRLKIQMDLLQRKNAEMLQEREKIYKRLLQEHLIRNEKELHLVDEVQHALDQLQRVQSRYTTFQLRIEELQGELETLNDDQKDGSTLDQFCTEISELQIRLEQEAKLRREFEAKIAKFQTERSMMLNKIKDQEQIIQELTNVDLGKKRSFFGFLRS